MRSLVMEIAACARSIDPDFIVIPQNGQELITTSGEPEGPIASAYVSAIDGQGREDLYYGYDADDTSTPAEETNWMEGFLLENSTNFGNKDFFVSGIDATDYRYYWKPSWSISPASFMEEENPNWPGNYKVRYWDPQWKAILFGSLNAYLDRIIAAGFDGVYLDIIDAFEYFEQQTAQLMIDIFIRDIQAISY